MQEQKIKKNDFIEVEFTGKSNNEIFDTTNKEEAKLMGIDADVKPLIISVGNQMILKGFDEQLEGKEINKKHSIKISPQDAFGLRDAKLIKTLPMKIFKEKNIQPFPGMSFQMDQYLVKILSVSGGRVIADFNNPLAGKEVNYDFSIKRIVEDINEKVNALQDFFFRQRFEFSLDEQNKKVTFKKPEIKPLIEMMNQKFKEITGFDFSVEEIKKDTKEKKEEKR
ncbi:MAG: peptidylprolyl isomerase [Candidatus Pacearchaeota archaeon]